MILGGVGFRNLEAPSGSFVGRSDALETLRAAVRAHPVVAVVGTAGAGKTRTTIELFLRHGPELAPHGAWFVDLRDVTDEAGMLAAIASALGITLGADPIARLASAIGDKTLVLDHFEKIVACAPILQRLGGRLVITTREVLRIGEHRVELGALPAVEAEQLFNARAGTSPSDDVRALCDALDGVPLAIELAASRARVLSPRQLREQLTRRFDLLRRGEATLRGAIDVSWELLSDNERAVLAQCSVFRGSFTLEAAEGVVRAEGWVLDAIESLVDRSLIQVIGGDPIRYRLFETIRDYAREKLEDPAVLDRHAAFYRAHVAEIDRENVIAAHRHSLARDRIDEAFDALFALDLLLALRGPTTLRIELLDAALAVKGGDPNARARLHLRRAGARLELGRAADARADREAARALATDRETSGRVLESLGLGAWHGGDIPAARVHFEEAIAEFAEGPLRARTEVFLANALYFLGEVDDARRLYQQAIVALRAASDLRTLALAVANLGSLEHDLGNLDEARRGYLEAQELEQKLGMRSDEGIAQMNLGHLALELFDIDEARAFYERAIAIQREVGSRRWGAIALGYLGLCHEIAGRRDQARDVYLEAIAKHDEDGDAVFGGLTRCWLARVQAARGSLNEARETLRKGREGIVRGGATLFEHVATIVAAQIEGAGVEEAIEAARDARSSEVRIALRMLQTRGGTALTVSASARSVTLPDGAAIDLSTRAPLRRLVVALAEARGALTLDELVQHGWPGEKLVGTTGPDRAYAAISTLRKLGLRVLRRDDGYLLDPAVPIRRVED